MEETQHQTLTNCDDIKGVLEQLGYKLKDFGNHWRTSAIYRSGLNAMSIKVYKNTGVWQDHGSSTSPMPFRKLVELTLNTKDPQIIKKYIGSVDTSEIKYVAKEKIEMDKIYTEDCLNRLFPNYSFYKKRKISEETQKQYKCGLASSGQMYQRIVFPIYNNLQQIIGFSGRKINDANEAPKWKHIGTKARWIYPAFVPRDGKLVNEIIDEKREVILVESIGDSLALTEEGYCHNLVTFGLDCSPSLLNYLCSKSLDRIIIATNNDADKPRNHGKISAMKNYMKLSQFFNFEQLSVQLPWANDFSDMRQQEMSFADWYKTPQTSQEQKLHDYKEFCLENRSVFHDKKLNKFLKKIEDFGI